MSIGILVLALSLLAGCFYERRPWIADEEFGTGPRRNPVSVEDVLRLTKAGIGEDVIVSWIRTEGVSARPSSDDILRMKKECVGDRAIEALLTAPIPRPAPEPRYRRDVGPWWFWEPYPWGWFWPSWRFEYRFRG